MSSTSINPYIQDWWFPVIKNGLFKVLFSLFNIFILWIIGVPSFHPQMVGKWSNGYRSTRYFTLYRLWTYRIPNVLKYPFKSIDLIIDHRNHGYGLGVGSSCSSTIRVTLKEVIRNTAATAAGGKRACYQWLLMVDVTGYKQTTRLQKFNDFAPDGKPSI